MLPPDRSRTRRGRFLALVLLLATPALADEPQPQPCGKREAVVAFLAREYGERAVARGATDDGSAIVEIFASQAGTWTAVTTTPDGQACIGVSGKLWRLLAVPVEGKAG